MIKRNLRPILFFVVASFISILAIVFVNDQVNPSDEYQSVGGEVGVKTTDLIFAGHMYSHVDQYEDILNRISIYNPDFIVTGGDAIWSTSDENIKNLDSFIDGAKDISGEVVVVKGNHDINYARTKDQKPVSSTTNEGVTVINIDTTTNTDGGESCGLTDGQITSLGEEIDTAEENKIILVMHHALWANSEYLPSQKPNHPTLCAGSSWQDKVLPLITNKVLAVISGDGGLYGSYQSDIKNGITYLLTGMNIHEKVRGGEAVGGPSLITLARLRFTEEGFTHGPVRFQNEDLLDNEALKDVDTYNVAVKQKELENIYNISPLYPPDTNWQKMIEPIDIKEQIQAKLDAEVSFNDSTAEEATLSIRGNVGNHWGDYKKSWDLEFTDTDKRQVKLVIPSDRGYVNQMYAQYVSEQLGVPTPEITIKRLIINGIDFGVYLQYEDFDKAFIELNGFNSDAVPSKNNFRDHHNVYSIDKNISNSTGDKEDKTYQQNLSTLELSPENFSTYFDKDNYARWLATQIILGDVHQNLGDNFRYFIDRPTGRYIMVTWDASLSKLNESEIIPNTKYNNMFVADKDNKELVVKYVNQFLSQSSKHEIVLNNLINTTEPLFSNDPALTIETNNLKSSLGGLLGTYKNNIAKLDGWTGN